MRTANVLSESGRQRALGYKGLQQRDLLTGAASLGEQAGEWTHVTALQIKEYGFLERDWDSYAAPPISVEAIEAAISLVESLAVLPWKPFVGPTAEGGVEFEWSSDIGSLSIEVKPNGDHEVFYWIHGDSEFHGELGQEPEYLPDVLERLFQRFPN